MRSLLSILLIGVPVTLILTLVGLTQGMLQDAQTRQRGAGADIVIRGSTATSVATMSGPSIPEGVVSKIEEQPHVKLAMGVINHPIDLPLLVTGIDVAKFNAMTGGFTFDSGGTFQGPDDILIDTYYAAQRSARVGSTLDLMGHKWRVAGIVQPGKLARIAMPLNVLQDLDAASHKVGQIYVKVDDPANISKVVGDLQHLLPPDYHVNTMAEYLALYSVSNIQGVREFTVVVMAIGVIIGFCVVCLSQYMSVLQRTREIGILKALGASNGFILGIVLLEALLLGVGGTIIGVLLSFGAYWLIGTLVPASIPMIIVPGWWPIAGAITLVGAGLGALYPGLSAARHDPIEALAYE